MREFKQHTYRHLVASPELSSAARCEKICADISSCLCTRNSNAPSPDISGIAPPADTGRCKGEKRARSDEEIAVTNVSLRIAVLTHKYLKVGICSAEHVGGNLRFLQQLYPVRVHGRLAPRV